MFNNQLPVTNNQLTNELFFSVSSVTSVALKIRGIATNIMKKQNTVFTFNFCLFTLFSLCLSSFVATWLFITLLLCVLVALWLLNYAKQTQFAIATKGTQPSY
jgi:hypothetical protein